MLGGYLLLFAVFWTLFPFYAIGDVCSPAVNGLDDGGLCRCGRSLLTTATPAAKT